MSTSEFTVDDGYVSVCPSEGKVHLHVERFDLPEDQAPATVHLTVQQAHEIAAELLATAYGFKYNYNFFSALKALVAAERGWMRSTD